MKMLSYSKHLRSQELSNRFLIVTDLLNNLKVKLNNYLALLSK